MKTCFTFLLCLLLGQAVVASPVLDHLIAVNAQWTQQPDARLDGVTGISQLSETEWIRLHLKLVEQTLRGRSVAGLNERQLQNRRAALSHLHQYWQEGRFPQNEDYTFRTPIFIDRHETFCAVGYLIKTSGAEPLARMISERSNLAYVPDMHYPELDAWAAENGFTKAELAWIQPGYPPKDFTMPLGKGVNGEVHELFAAGDTLYVGGRFSTADTISAANIAFVTEDRGQYTWHSMGSGVEGPVYAIAQHRGRIYIAGAFDKTGDSAVNNIAYWENGRWNPAGCLYGEVRDLLTVRDTLYAAGSFDVCAALADINFARLEGNTWRQLPGLSGHVNTLEQQDDYLMLGGAFTYQGDTVNAIRWSSTGGFRPFDAAVHNEVYDFESRSGAFFAATQWKPGGDSLHLLLRLNNNRWDTTFSLNYLPAGGSFWSPGASFRTLAISGDVLMIGGSFRLNTMRFAENTYAVNVSPGSSFPYYPASSFYVNDLVHKLIYFKGELYAGGRFHSGYDAHQTSIVLNGIARRAVEPVSISLPMAPDPFAVYPNPAHSGATILLNGRAKAASYRLLDATGKSVGEGRLQATGQQSLQLPQLPAGLYFLKVSDEQGSAQVYKLSTF